MAGVQLHAHIERPLAVIVAMHDGSKPGARGLER